VIAWGLRGDGFAAHTPVSGAAQLAAGADAALRARAAQLPKSLCRRDLSSCKRGSVVDWFGSGLERCLNCMCASIARRVEGWAPGGYAIASFCSRALDIEQVNFTRFHWPTLVRAMALSSLQVTSRSDELPTGCATFGRILRSKSLWDAKRQRWWLVKRMPRSACSYGQLSQGGSVGSLLWNDASGGRSQSSFSCRSSTRGDCDEHD
jgi:hypothetical protein